MAARRWSAVLVAVALAVPLVFVAGLATGKDAPAANAAATDYGGSGEFHPLDNRRLVDTRSAPGGGNQISGARQFNSTVNVRLTGVGAIGGGAAPVPSSGVQSVLLNITVMNPSTSGWVGAYPAGRSSPNRAVLQVQPGRIRTNLVLVQPGAGGQVSIVMVAPSLAGRGGALHLMVDVAGWFGTTSAPRGARLTPLASGRILDTAHGFGAPARPVGPGQQVALRIRGAQAYNPSRPGIVPNSSGVTAVALSLSVVRPSANTWITFPRAGAIGVASSVAPYAGTTTTTMVVVPVGADGTVRIVNARGTVHLVADVLGYFVAGASSTTRAGRVLPLSAPFASIDTRLPPAVGKLPAGTTETWDFTPFVNSLTASGAGVGRQVGLFVDLTALNLTYPYNTGQSASYLAANQGGVGNLHTANLNFTRGEVTAATSIVRFGASNRIAFYNGTGFTDYIVDVLGVVLAD